MGKKRTARRRLTGLDAAALVLAETGKPMNCPSMVKVMLQKGYWSTNGRTPAATIYAGIRREIETKGGLSRFRKVGKGLFVLASY